MVCVVPVKVLSAGCQRSALTRRGWTDVWYEGDAVRLSSVQVRRQGKAGDVRHCLLEELLVVSAVHGRSGSVHSDPICGAMNALLSTSLTGK